MTAPAEAAARFGAACLIGAGLGLLYGFLRPLRPRHTVLADGLFLLAALWGWLLLAFGICRGDFRFSYCAGLILGGIVWECTAGRLLRPVFSAFWKIFRKICGLLLLPVKNFLNLTKKMFASGEKWVTIRWSNRRHMTHTFGGKPYGRNKRIFQPDQAGADAHPQSGEGGAGHRHRIVYGRADRPADLRE